MKRVLIALAVLLALLITPVVVMFAMVFGAVAPLEADLDLPNGARLVKDGYVNIGVLPAGDGAVALIDAGNDATGAALLAELKRKNLETSAVKAIFFTHGHPDHIAASHLFKDAQVLVLPGDVALAQGSGRSKGPLPSRFDIPPEKLAKVTRPLADGETVDIGPLAVKVYAVPGHTAGSAAYLSGGVLYLGDSASASKEGTVIGAPWVFTDDQAENRASVVALAKRLKAEGAVVTKVVFSHSAPLDGDAALMAYDGSR
ncbi:MAG: MBL fold metallo-hydrolase [Myxococcaceae bacterium]|nr:MBL fold metallo-hydrolase [Myxococcaceae bacterium]